MSIGRSQFVFLLARSLEYLTSARIMNVHRAQLLLTLLRLLCMQYSMSFPFNPPRYNKPHSLSRISLSLPIHLCTFQNPLKQAMANPKSSIPIVIPVTAIFFFKNLPCKSFPLLGQATNRIHKKIPGISFHLVNPTADILSNSSRSLCSV